VVTVNGPGQVTTKAGATLMVPAGFVAKVEGSVVTLEEPDHLIELKLVEQDGEDLAAAIAGAWSLLDPGWSTAAEQTIEPPAKDGWEAIRVEGYPKGADGKNAQAVARRLGDRIWVSVLRGPGPALEKRAAQVRSFLGSLDVPGMAKIDLLSKTLVPLGERRAELDTFIKGALEKTGTPGFQLAIVENGQVVHAAGFGVRELGKKKPVDADTLMMIGSVSKSFTTLLMASAVDEGKLRWDAKVQDTLPNFALGDPALAANLKVEELVCACSGIPRRDMPIVFEFEKKTPEDVFVELAQLKPTTGLRETFQYQNHLVAAGGYLAARALYPKMPAGVGYDRAIQERIFAPLGMKRSTLDFDRAVKDPNHALPHAVDLDGQHQKVALGHERFATYIRPSGGIWSSANEMARYLTHELGQAAALGVKPIASDANRQHRFERQVAIGNDVHYGLGFIVAKSKGIQVISHGGGTMGFATFLFFLPEKGVGAVMIANGTGGHQVEGAVRAKLMELWFGIDDKSQESFDTGVEAQKKAFAQLLTEAKVPEAAFLTPLVGTYHSPDLGELKLSLVKGEAWVDAGAFKTRVLHHIRKDGRVALLFRDPALAGLELMIQPEGGLLLDIGQDKFPLQKKK
jgi:CubicO group peptidase (beta-lactamase class C family)